ncbi:MAG TPA: CPBP family glutamic-type intramembrane protease [Candidatus Acidoferrales bacterium]|nr:CPBP family glutamic-type intramembrane protease [Candidatus Acidoferrales bacterium]
MTKQEINPLLASSRRLGAFLRDFLPEKNLQLLFPFASLVLFVGGSSPWLPPGHVLSSLQFRHQDGTLWFDISTRLLLLRYYAILDAVSLSFLGSVALWCLPVGTLWKKFAIWVLLPSAIAITSFLAIVLLHQAQPPSVLEAADQALQSDLLAFPDRLLHLGVGFYVTLLGISLYAGALWIARVCRVPLPVRFAERPIRRGDSSQASEIGRKIFVMLIAATAIAILVQLAIFTSMVPTAAGALPWYDDWPRHFAAFRWLPGLLDGLAVVAIAFLVFRPDQRRLQAPSSNSVAWPAAIAIAIPLAVALIPRLILKGLFNFSTVLSNVPYEFLGLGAFPWVLIVFGIAALQEFVLRLYLQNRFEEKFGFKRACLLVALLWWLLPLSIGLGPVPGLRIGIPGVSVFISLLVHILYNVPLAWLWSRTRSLWLVTIMHGAILLFRSGDFAYTIYFTFRYLYWIETAAWLLITWHLLKKFPPGDLKTAVEPRSI